MLLHTNHQHESLLVANQPQTEREPQSHIKHFAQISLYIFLNQIPLTRSLTLNILSAHRLFMHPVRDSDI